MSTSPSITQRELARRLKLSQSTVSLALSGSPRLPEATRLRVLRGARELNYRIDPALAALAAYRSKKQKPSFKGILAWLTNHETRDGWRVSFFERYHAGFTQTAAAAGYQVNDYWLREPGHSARRVADIMEARGVNGVAIAPQPLAGTRLDIDLAAFPVITFGYSLAYPCFHLVTSSGFGLMKRLYEKLRQLNHRRICLVYEQDVDDRMDNILSAAYLSFQSMSGIARPRRPFTLRSLESQGDELKAWLTAERPDAIICTDLRLHDWLLRAGYRIPEDLSFAANLVPSQGEIGGCLVDHHRIGVLGAQRLVSMIQHWETGPALLPERTLVEGNFWPGKTVRARESRPD